VLGLFAVVVIYYNSKTVSSLETLLANNSGKLLCENRVIRKLKKLRKLKKGYIDGHVNTI